MDRIISRMLIIVIAACCITACTPPEREIPEPSRFTVDKILGYTPVKNQGNSSLCWVYAMLSTIETEHIMRGDSVNLSAAYVARMLLKEQIDACYLSGGKRIIRQRGTMPKLIRLIMDHGLMPYDSYHSDANISVVGRKLRQQLAANASRGAGLQKANADADYLLDHSINPLPYHVYMYSMEYTPLEFAHSVCMPDEYRAYTSFSHIPMNEDAPLDIPDNDEGFLFHNISVDSLLSIMESAVMKGHPVCWEGDVSESGASLSEGVADVEEVNRNATQQQRQREFERLLTTDDHCMSIIGIAHDKSGRKFFICKNSYGADNASHGLVYMSFDYARLKTVAIMTLAHIL